MPPDLSPLHPDLHDAWKSFPRMPLNRVSVRVINLFMSLMPTPPLSEHIQISQHYASRDDSAHRVKIRFYRPESPEPVPVLVHMHGGGLVIGTPKQEDRYLTTLIEKTGIAIASVDYRLAASAPYPAAIEDCYTALTWVHAHAEQLGIDRDRLGVSGVSAGGGLAASLAQMAHDRGDIAIAFQFLIYPMLDDRSSVRDDVPHPELLTWTPAHNRFGWEAYLRQAAGSDDVPPYAVPARREDLTGLPPTWIGVGALDLFHEESVAYADRLRDCGVDCDLTVIEGAFHGFDFMDAPVQPVQDFRAAQVAALKSYL